jgi:hypothetical protein
MEGSEIKMFEKLGSLRGLRSLLDEAKQGPALFQYCEASSKEVLTARVKIDLNDIVLERDEPSQISPPPSTPPFPKHKNRVTLCLPNTLFPKGFEDGV